MTDRRAGVVYRLDVNRGLATASVRGTVPGLKRQGLIIKPI